MINMKLICFHIYERVQQRENAINPAVSILSIDKIF